MKHKRAQNASPRALAQSPSSRALAQTLMAQFSMACALTFRGASIGHTTNKQASKQEAR